MDKKPSRKTASDDGRAAAEQAPPPLSPPGVGLPRASAPAREETLALVPVRNMVLFPGVVLPVVVSRPKSIDTVMEAVRRKEPLALVLQKDEKVEEPRRDIDLGIDRMLGEAESLLRDGLVGALVVFLWAALLLQAAPGLRCARCAAVIAMPA